MNGQLSSRFTEGPLSVEKEGAVSSLIRRNLVGFDERESVLVSTFRRLKHLHEAYMQEGCQFWVISDMHQGSKPIGCAGLGPFHGLPLSEGVGEIRDLVVEESMRGQGIGKHLLETALHSAKTLGYRRLYLETSKSMIVAQRLFESRGFRAVTEARFVTGSTGAPDVPCYYLLENL